jgi:hypothetical protein
MTPIDFPGACLRIGEGQPEYQVLPAVPGLHNGEIITCWRPAFWERVKLLFTGRVWLHQLTFGQPLQPVILSCHKLFVLDTSGRTVEARTDLQTDD